MERVLVSEDSRDCQATPVLDAHRHVPRLRAPKRRSCAPHAPVLQAGQEPTHPERVVRSAHELAAEQQLVSLHRDQLAPRSRDSERARGYDRSRDSDSQQRSDRHPVSSVKEPPQPPPCRHQVAASRGNGASRVGLRAAVAQV
eukprot:Amastigsp_a174469_227.p3 type:complete len:143 gc:universal Amastigsp_a174469_227:970-1398(+)